MRIGKILLPESELRKIEEEKEKWAQKGLETGGYLFGRLQANGVAEVTHVVDGGPKAERGPASYSGDNEYATRVRDELRKEDPEILLLGEYHLHPWEGLPTLSCGDMQQLKEAKGLRPWFIVLLNTKDQFKVWDVKDCLEPIEVQAQVIKGGAEVKEKLLDRILKITRHELLANKTALIVGLGSGGSVIAKYLGCTGLGRLILVDNEELEAVNVIRHEGCIEEIGERKVEICKKVIESHNPYTLVEAYDFDATKNIEKLAELTHESDLIIGSSGNPKVNLILNALSLENKIPAVYGGVYERALGGFALAVKPFETACFNCLFGLSSDNQPYYVDREAAERYGLNEEELHQQQGLWIDISLPAIIAAKLALTMLEEREFDFNLVLYDSSLDLKKLKVERRENCAACDEEGWMKEILGGT
ncbi:MAG: HesA/MoeB/ThiF family protein [Nitrososphaerales archaeon]